MNAITWTMRHHSHWIGSLGEFQCDLVRENGRWWHDGKDYADLEDAQEAVRRTWERMVLSVFLPEERQQSCDHIGSEDPRGFMSDGWKCSCGWKSQSYFDGQEYAEHEWKQHKKAVESPLDEQVGALVAERNALARHSLQSGQAAAVAVLQAKKIRNRADGLELALREARAKVLAWGERAPERYRDELAADLAAIDAVLEA